MVPDRGVDPVPIGRGCIHDFVGWQRGRQLTDRNLQAYAFSQDGKQVYGIYRNTTGEGPPWQLHLIGIKGDTDKMIAALDFPVSTSTAIGFSINPDGKRFLTSIAKWPYDIWVFEGFDQPRPKTWLDRLLLR